MPAPLRNALLLLAGVVIMAGVLIHLRSAPYANAVEITYRPGVGAHTQRATLTCPGTTATTRRACRVLQRAAQTGMLQERPENGPGALTLQGAIGALDIDAVIRGPDEPRFRALARSVMPLLP